MWNPNSGWVWWKHTNCMSWSCHHGHGLLLAWQETTWVHIPPKFHQNVTRNHYPLYFVDPSEGSEAAQLAMTPPETTSLTNGCKINGWKCSLMCNSKSYHNSSSAHFASTLSLGGLAHHRFSTKTHDVFYLCFSKCFVNSLWVVKIYEMQKSCRSCQLESCDQKGFDGNKLLGGFQTWPIDFLGSFEM